MRRVATAALAALALGAGPAHAHSGFIDVADRRYDPATVRTVPGEVISWHWRGPDTNHSVTSDTGLFDSDPGRGPLQVDHRRGDTFSYSFAEPGTYAYHCKVHAEMHWTIEVAQAPRTDRRRPRLTRLRAHVRGARAIVRFRVGEPVSVLAEVRRPRARRVLRSSFRFVGAGRRRTTVKLPGRGRFRVRLEAQDDAGNVSRPRTVEVRR